MRFNFEATATGSVPFRSAKEACRLIFGLFREIPFWPQLPKRSFRESMYVQYSERLPGLVLDENRRTVHIDTLKAARETEEVLERYLAGDAEYFRMSEAYAEGFYEFLDGLPSGDKEMKFVKGHITGPVSYALTLTDENKRAVFYDKGLLEALTKTLCMKARWQIRKLKGRFPDAMLFIDEPYLVSIGSSYVNIDAEEAFGKIGELVTAIKEEGALSGIHCCGNTDWPRLLASGVDILSFDAYNYTKEFALYGREIKDYLLKGSGIAWGIVPSADTIDKEDEKTLASKLLSAIKLLDDKGIKSEGLSCLITPSCGVGSLDEERATKALKITAELAKRFGK